MTRTDTSTTTVPAQVPDGWMGVAEALEHAAGISFDGCHKIYILLDEEQVAQQESYGYGSGDGDSELVRLGRSDDGRASAYAIVQDWYASSCSLRFVQGIATVPGADDRFYPIIGQFDEAE